MPLSFKSRKNAQQSLVRRILRNISLFTFITILIIIGIFIYRRYQTFQDRKEEIRLNILKKNMEDIKKETNAAYRYIQYSRKSHKEQLIQQLKADVRAQYNFVKHNFTANKGDKKPGLIISELKNYYKKADNYEHFFLLMLNGSCIINKEYPEWEGRNIMEFEDYAGQPLFKDIISNLRNGEDALIRYKNSEQQKDTLFGGKVIYAKKFAPLGLVVGKILKPSNHLESVKKSILTLLTEIRFGSEGYVFVNSYDGVALIKDGNLLEEKTNIWNLTDPNGVKVIQEEYKAAQIPGGDYIFYSWRKLTNDKVAPKVSFIRGIDSFEWMIGAGSYIDIIGDRIEQEQQQLEVELLKDVVFILISMLILIIIAYFVIRNYLILAKTNINHFTSFFNTAGKEFIRIDKSKLKFIEFQKLADSVNNMIDDRERMSSQMDKERLLFRYIIDSIPDLIVYKKMDGTYLGCNKAFEKAFEVYAKNMTGKKADDIYPDNQAKKFGNLDKKLMETHQPVRKEEWITLPNGHNYLYDIYKTFYYDHEGNTLGIIAIARDITQKEMGRVDLQKALEKADESNKIKTAFLENLSHEIRTPLNAISGFSSLIRDEELSMEELSSSVGQISRASDRILKVIESILNLSRIQVGEISFKKQEISLKKLLNEIASATKERFVNEKLNVEIKVNLNDCPSTFITDEYWFSIALENIFDNAFKFTKKGEIKVICHKATDYMKISVSDTGIGIPKGSEDKVFDYFTQLTNTMNKKYTGTGCGLYISQYIIEHIGGDIWYESEENKGSTFFITIPYTPPSKKLPAEPEA